MGSKQRRLTIPTLKTLCFAVTMIIVCFVILIYIAKTKPQLLKSPLSTSTEPVEPLQTPMLDNLINRISDVAQGILNRGTTTQAVDQLMERTKSSLQWIAFSAKGISQPTYLRWDLISNADVHILHKLEAYLRHIKTQVQSEEELDRLVYNGYQCTPLQAAQQELISKFISMDICSEIEWYKLVQLAMPEMKTFLDIGANKGYLGSLFLALWGGGKLGINPAKIFALSTTLKTWPSSRNPAGYCKDGYNHGVQAYCPPSATRDPGTGRCNSDQSVKVYSFDGSSYLSETLNTLIREHLAKENTQFAFRGTSPWVYANAAISDKVGTARFTKQNRTMMAGFEGGHIHNAQNAGETEEVPMITVDTFLSRQGLTHVDILKIDTEGQDNKVLLGAREALQTGVAMFTFEGGKGVTLSRDMLQEFDSWGFSCYSTSRAGLFKWNGGCMKEKYMGGFRAKDKGNIFCVSRKLAPMAAFAYDALTFPVMIESLLRDPKGVSPGRLQKLKAALVDSAQTTKKEVTLSSKVNPETLIPLYVSIHPFCTPYPQCVAVEEPGQQ